jgi:hypothetical protein
MLAPIVEIFCDLDDFCNQFFQDQSSYFLPKPNRKRMRPCRLATSEIMTIVVLFHLSHYRTFKNFYLECVEKEIKNYFPELVSYNRFVELMPTVFTPLTAYLLSRRGQSTGLYFVDSTSLEVCHNKRIYRHKTFANIAKRGKTSMGWFFGMKLHLVINHLGELVSFCITPGNVDDRKPLEILFKNLTGLAAGDKGYLSKEKKEKLEGQGVKLITKVRRKMKEPELTSFEKLFLGFRGIVETVIDQFKSICHIEHTRHRSPDNFLINLLSGLVAYIFKPRKPNVKLNQLQVLTPN